jgi:hypothetical protein
LNYILFIGFAIIQLPDFLLVVYNHLSKTKHVGKVKQSDLANTGSSFNTVRPQSNPRGQNESVLNEARLRKLEEDMKKMFGKLDEIINKNHED